MRLIKIDPSTKTVEYIDNDGHLDALLAVIGCRMIDICAHQANGDALTVDDEALFLEPQPAAFRAWQKGDDGRAGQSHQRRPWSACSAS